MAKKKKSLSEAVSAEIQSNFNLDAFKEKKGLKQNIKFKDQEWIPLSPAFQDVTSIPGIPMGHIVLLRGHSDTGKTTALLEAAVAAQTRKILPVFIITEMKWSWDHAKMMGMDVREVINEETGEVENYEGNFIYVDRETINYSYGIQLVQYLVKCQLNQIKTTMNGMQVLCQLNLVIV